MKMRPIEAQKVINDFHESIKDSRPDNIVQSSKKLPYTYARIKYAHFIFAEELIGRAEMTEENFQETMESYGIINSLFSENPESINLKYREYLEGLKNGIVTDFRMPNPFGEVGSVNEIYNFIGEGWFLKHHTNLFTGNPLGAFIYEGLRNKAIKEKDIKLLIEMVNTSLTRAVRYPGKKSNAESVFIKNE